MFWISTLLIRLKFSFPLSFNLPKPSAEETGRRKPGAEQREVMQKKNFESKQRTLKKELSVSNIILLSSRKTLPEVEL